MEQLKLTNQEQVYYGECFQTCDVDGNGKISNIRASDLFMHAGLGPEVLLQVCMKGHFPEVFFKCIVIERYCRMACVVNLHCSVSVICFMLIKLFA